MEFLTLAEYEQKAPNPLTQGIARQLRNESVWIDQMKFMTTGTNKATNYRETYEETDVLWRGYNEELGSVAHGKPEEVQSVAYAFGNSIKVDHNLVEAKDITQIYDPRVRQTEITVRKMARQLADVMINNTAALNPKAPIGLKALIDDQFPGQKFIAGSSAGLDLLPSGSSYAANNKIFWRELDKFKYRIDGGATHILCNSTFLLNLKALARESGFLTTTKDALGRDITEYDGMKFIDVGVSNRKSETMIITNNEAVAGGPATTTDKDWTSIYAIRMDPTHFQPWQQYPLKVDDHGRLKGSVYYQTDIEWVIGYLITEKKSIARLTGLKLAQ